MKNKTEKTAIIDLGSNSVRLIIILIQKGKHYKLIEQEKEMVRLGENLYEDNLLKEEAMERTLKTLRLFRDLIESQGAENVILTATAAVRNANNKDVFLEKIKNEFGWDFQVISGEREAYLGYLGVINTINEKNFYIADIGGGSTEISLVENRKLVNSISLNYGSVTLENNEELLSKILAEIHWLKKPGLPLVGLGGTIRSFAKIYKKNSSYPVDKLHNLEISLDDAKKTIDIVIKKKVEDLHKVNGLDKSRTDIIIPGLKIFNSIIKVCKTNKIIISGNGLREGLFFEYLLRDKKEPIFKDVRHKSIKNLMYNYEVNKKHVKNVKKIAGDLFNSTLSLHGIPEDNLKYLEYAASLHDLGIYIDYYSHHRHSGYLIMNSSLDGFNHKELIILSSLAGKHRNKSYKVDFTRFRNLISKEDIHLITVLSLLLRIAENLDRREEGRITSLYKSDEKQGSITISLKSDDDISLEIAAALKSGEDFKKIFGKELIFAKDKSPLS